VTVPPELLEEIDCYLQEKPELDRSAVVGEALKLWHAQRLRAAIREEILRGREVEDPEEKADWKAIRRASLETRASRWT
jgi:metal-responsive CopG/Arc/MetJ family transcriptional regulator